MKKLVLTAVVCLTIAACGGRQVTRVMPLAESADAPYDNVLVVSLFESFDSRAILERAIVDQLAKRGVRAAASTSRMTTRTPLNRDTLGAIVEQLDSDGVLVTQVVDVETKGAVKTKRPQATYNVSPTYYYNVWNVELTEYTEPPSIEVTDKVLLATQMYSARTREPVWGIESATTVTKYLEDPMALSIVFDEAESIVRYLEKDGLIAD